MAKNGQYEKNRRKGMDAGVTNDLEEATHQAYLAIANLGMDEELGFVHTDTLTHNVNSKFFQEVVEVLGPCLN